MYVYYFPDTNTLSLHVSSLNTTIHIHKQEHISILHVSITENIDVVLHIQY